MSNNMGCFQDYFLFLSLLLLLMVKGTFAITAFMCGLTQVVYYERNIGLIHTREEKPNLAYKQERSGF